VHGGRLHADPGGRRPSVASALVVEFLSDAWIARLDAAARAADDLATDPPFVVETLVRSPRGDTGHRVHFAADGATVTGPSSAPDGDGADVVLVTDPETAWALHQGALRAQDAFARGALKLRGRPELLATHADLLAALERALVPVRAETTAPGTTSTGTTRPGTTPPDAR
jgi:hypothetical protein